MGTGTSYGHRFVLDCGFGGGSGRASARPDDVEDAARRYLIHFSLANDVIYSIDRAYVVTSVSPSVERVLGYRPEELVGRPFYELKVVPDEDVEKAIREIERVLGGEKIVSSTYRFITRQGDLRYGEVSGVPYMRFGKPVEVISVARDITERVEMEQILRQSEERFRAVFDSARDCIFMKDTDLRYTFVNPYMERLVGRPSKDIVGRTDSDLFGDDAPHDTTGTDRMALAGEEVEHECTWTVPSGNVILHMVKVPVRDGSLGITGLCGIARDITERRIAEQRLVKKEQELASQARRLEEMNIALKVLWETSEKEKRQTLGIIAARIRRSLAPHLELLQQALRDERGAAILSVVKANLEEVLALDSSPYIRLTKRLTPMELKVADLIRMGKSSK
ncbi:MAG TPA: PAS domain S-box protein, partial [Deltaproteobacteria bacterium]|nr:PAS domain S-box protein [Deltaproteobacteria bacterium]